MITAMPADADGPPPQLVQALVGAPSVLSGLEWHPVADSTNRLAAQAAARGVDELYAVLADRQTAGRGRRGRDWQAPPGTSLLLSLVCRPAVPAEALPLLGLLTGLALADAVEPLCAGAGVGLKWPNDLLVGGRKAAGILVESPAAGQAVVGVGVNVDWRTVQRPPALEAATSLAEAAGRGVDRWKVLAAFVGVFARRYRDWPEAPAGFLEAYRRRCTTLGRRVRVARPGAGGLLEGVAVGVDARGRLQVRDDAGGLVAVSAGDVEHVRPARPRGVSGW